MSEEMKSNVAGMWQRKNSNQFCLTSNILFLMTMLCGFSAFMIYIKQMFVMIGLIKYKTIVVLPLSGKL